MICIFPLFKKTELNIGLIGVGVFFGGAPEPLSWQPRFKTKNGGTKDHFKLEEMKIMI